MGSFPDSLSRAWTAWWAGSREWGRLAGVLLALALLPSVGISQVRPDPVPPDTVPRDTVPRAQPEDTIRVPIPPGQVAPDTLPTDSIRQDSVIPVPPFPRWPQRMPVGWAFGRWEWDREELLRYNGLSLVQLLERIPGLTATRAGDFGSPIGVSALGLGGAQLRVFVDGFELDPLGHTTPDLQQIGLADLESVRVQRGPNGIRVELTPLRMPEDARPVSVIEAATGLYDTKLLRALLMRSMGTRSVIKATYEQATSAGFGFQQPATVSSARVGWSYALSERSALQLEYITSGAESAAESWPRDAKGRTLLLRGRSELLPGLMADGMLARTTRRPEEADPLDVPLSSVQGAARVGYELERAWVEGALRVRGAGGAVGYPGAELSARGAVQPLSWLAAEAEARLETLAGVAGVEWSGTLRAEPVAGLGAFATLATGDRALGLVRDTVREEVRRRVVAGETVEDTVLLTVPRFSAVPTGAAAVRVGADWTRGGATLGVAGVTVGAGEVAPFGFFALDRELAPVSVGAASGVEAHLSAPVPLTRGLLRLEGWYNRWLTTGGRPYLPEEMGRLALLVHRQFYDGQLEPTLRVEVVGRGSARVATPGGDGFDARSVPYAMANLYLQIRILDVRAFLVFDNLTDLRTTADIPQRFLPGGRLYYGIHWTFRN